MSYFKGETKSFSGSPGGVYNIQVQASRNTAEGGLCVCVCVSKPILSYCAKCWSQHSAVQTGSMGTLEQCLSWSGSSEQTGELKKKMWRIVNTSVRVCVCLFVYTQPWLRPCEKRPFPLLSTVCVYGCVWTGEQPLFCVQPVASETHKYTYLHTTLMQTNPYWSSST